MSKASKLASLAVDVNNLSDLADQVTDIENAIVRANTNAQVIEGIADDIEALEANTADIMNDFTSISNVFNSGITYSTDGENEYYDANSVTNTVATVDIIEMNIQSPQEGDLMSFDAAANNWINSTATVQLESFRNKIINGDMRIDQRNSGSAISTHSNFVVDRINCALAGGSASGITVQQSSDVPSNSTFKNSIVYTTGNGGSVGATGTYGVQQRIEGYNFSDFMYGTSNAKQFTLSFWVKSSVSGNYGIGLRNSVKDRCYIATYSISPSLVNTWVYKKITVSGDISGTWLSDNGTGLDIFFSLGVGTSYSTTSNSWQNGNRFGLTGGVKPVETTGSTWYITGVQLEEGEVATPFEHRPYGLELSLCQRYYQQMWLSCISRDYNRRAHIFQNLIPNMRIKPSAKVYSRQTGTLNKVSYYSSGAEVDVENVRYLDTEEGVPIAISYVQCPSGSSFSTQPLWGRFTFDAEL